MNICDYLKPEFSQKPYEKNEDHLKDSLSWLKMLLDSFDIKGENSCPDTQEMLREESRKGYSYIEDRETATAGRDVFLPLCFLRYFFHMSRLEYLVFLLALAPELDPGFGELYSGFSGGKGQGYPTFSLGAALYSLWEPVRMQEVYLLCSEDTVLNRFCFQSPHEGEYFLLSPIRLKKKLLMYVSGVSYMEQAITCCCRRIDIEEPEEFLLVGEGSLSYYYGEERYRKITELCREALYGGGGPLLLYFPGEEGAGRKFMLKHMAREFGAGLLAVDMEKLRKEPGGILNDIILEAGLLGGGLLFENVNPETEEEASCCEEILRYAAGELPLILMSGREETLPIPMKSLNCICIPFPVPVFKERLAFWRKYSAACPAGASLGLDILAGAYSVTPGAIREIIKTAEMRRIYEGREYLTQKDLENAVSERRPLSFQHLAEKIPVIFNREDIELDRRQAEALTMALNRFKNRDLAGLWGFREKHGVRGVSLLFYGPPGTGKTMTAQVLAGEAGLELYRIDFSRIASKYIGETEKNLDRIFTEALKRNVVLFFDEADSLFSKRTEVKSSNDRYANAQTSYLLQKIEDYDGIVILATNLYHNFDDAFIRRITYAIRFERPDREMRKRLWEKLLPPEAPVAQDIDFAFLAEHFELSGSSVKSVLYNAACLAAGEGDRLEASHIVRALEQELLKTGKIVSAEDFGKYSIYLMQGELH